MPRKLYKRKLAIMLTAALALIGTSCSAQFFSGSDTPKSGLVDKVQSAEIDWGSEFYYATGEGTMPSADEEPDSGKAYTKARGYGKMKAIANLLMAIEGTTVSYKAVAKDYIAKDEPLRQALESYVSNAEIVGEKPRSQGSGSVLLVSIRVPMYDSKGVCSAVLKSRFQRDPSPDGPASGVNVEKRGDEKAGTISDDAKGPFTSLIVDCGGLRMDRAISPKLRHTDGSEFWGTALKFDFLQSHGVVAYAHTLDEAKAKSRAGSNPLIVRAAGRAGTRAMCDPVLSDVDIDRALLENRTSQFLDRFDVIFVVD